MSARLRLRAVWEELPLWFLAASPFGLLDFDRNQLGNPVAPALFFFLPPALVGLWILRRAGLVRGVAGWLVVGGVVGGAILSGWSAPPIPEPARKPLFEALALAEFAVLATHCLLTAGRGALALIFGTGLLYGTILESVGIGLGFFAEEGYRLRATAWTAPVATAVGWCVVLYPLWRAVPRVFRPGAPPWRLAAAATGIALALDLQMDPLATEAGFWVWNGSLPAAIRGVPAANFCAWGAAVFPFTLALFRAGGRPGSAALRVLQRLPLILAAAGVLFVFEVAVVEAAVGWPSLMLLGETYRRMAG